MAMLAADGFHAISIAQYARFAGGDVTALPDRPILITFDDGLLDSYQGADAILARYEHARDDVRDHRERRRRQARLSELAAAARDGGRRALGPAGARARGPRADPHRSRRPDRSLLREPGLPKPHPRDVHRLQAPGQLRHPHRPPPDGLRDPRLRAAGLRGALRRLRPGRTRTTRPSRPGRAAGCSARSRSYSCRSVASTTSPGNPIGQRYGVHSYTTAETLHKWLEEALPQSAWVFSAPKRPKVRRTARPPAKRRDHIQGARRHHVEARRGGAQDASTRPREGERRRPPARLRRLRPARCTSTAWSQWTARAGAARRSGSACTPTGGASQRDSA